MQVLVQEMQPHILPDLFYRQRSWQRWWRGCVIVGFGCWEWDLARYPLWTSGVTLRPSAWSGRKMNPFKHLTIYLEGGKGGGADPQICQYEPERILSTDGEPATPVLSFYLLIHIPETFLCTLACSAGWGFGRGSFRCRECNPSCTCRLIHPEIERNSGSITFGAALVHAQTVGANPYTKSQGPGGPAQQRVLLCADNLRVSNCVKDSYPPASSRVSLATQR